ncbi:MAG: hypothetical protein LAP21_11575 [Acidobacteriia bacterium]|nr:hypothetical protein [Terriglobia bacterium]
MNKLTLFILLLAGFAVQAQTAQNAKPADLPDRPNHVFDDDGGAVQIVPRNSAAPTTEKTFHGGAVMKSVCQVSIFLGSGWGDQQARARETALLDLSTGSNGSLSSELQKHGIKSAPSAPSQEDFSDLAKSPAPLNDLAIQRRLADMIEKKAVAAPTAETVFVVFLAPGLHSSLGAHQGGRDFAAYHNFFHAAAGEVRYVVVPFDSNPETHRQAAAQAFVNTALNPTGNGWF